MGNTIAKDNDTINWNNIKTDNLSDNMNVKHLSNDSKLLISKLQLNLPNVTETESDNISNVFTKYQSKSMNEEENTTTSVGANMNADDLSDTSPFISSDMYNYLMNKNQSGGSKQKGGAKLDDDSSTSSTSSSSDSEDDSDSNNSESEKPKGKNKKEKESEEQSEEQSSEELSGGSDNSDLSYVSSPADSDNNDSSQSSNNSSEELSGGSISNNNDDLPPSSINTSDINMISESS